MSSSATRCACLHALLLVAACGGPQKSRYDISSQDPEVQARKAEFELRQALNEFRAQKGLAELEDHTKLDGVARKHSAAMLSTEALFHEDPRGGTPNSRVKAVGFETGLVLENVGRGRDLLELTKSTFENPSQRNNLINPDVTHLGLGVAAKRDDFGSMLYATQLYVRLAPPIELEVADRDLLRLINNGRKARGTAPLQADPNLQEAGQAALKAFFEDPSIEERDAVEIGVAKMREFSIAYEQISGVMLVATTLREAARLEPTFRSDMRFAGIALARGDRPDVAPNATAILILLAAPR